MGTVAAARLKSAREAVGQGEVARTSRGARPAQRSDGGDGSGESTTTEGSGSMTSRTGTAADPTETPGGGDIEMGRRLL